MIINGARDPLAMGDDNYGRLCLELKFFLADATSLPHRPTHLVASQLAKADAFVAAIDAMNNAQNLMRSSTKELENAVKPLDEKLRWMRNILPTLTPGDDSILIAFGLDKKVPQAYEELKNYADAADAYWQTVALEPLYAPHADGCNELAGLIAEFEDKRMAQMSATSAYAAAQNAKDIARADHHLDERAIFGHYRAYYPKGDNLYWDQTPWGRATGGNAEPQPGGDETEWGMVQALEVWIDPIGNIVIRWKKVATAETYKLLREVVPIGSPAPVLPYSVYKTGIPPLEEYVAYGDVDHDPGFAYYYSVIAVNAAGEETEACPPKGVDYV